MKLAYFAYDESSVKNLCYLSKFFPEVHFYVVKNNAPVPLAFDDLAVLTRSFFIPGQPEKQTSFQKAIYSKLKKNIGALDYFYSDSSKSVNKVTTASQPGQHSVRPLNEVKKIERISKNSLLIESVQSSTLYDGLCVEPSILLNQRYKKILLPDSQLLQEILRFPVDPLIFMSVRLKKKGLHAASLYTKELLLVNNVDLDSIVDNFYFCRFDATGLTMDFLIAGALSDDSEYIQFLIQRAQRIAVERFISLEIGEAESHSFYPIYNRNSYSARESICFVPYTNGLKIEDINRLFSRQFDRQSFFKRRLQTMKELS